MNVENTIFESRANARKNNRFNDRRYYVPFNLNIILLGVLSSNLAKFNVSAQNRVSVTLLICPVTLSYPIQPPTLTKTTAYPIAFFFPLVRTLLHQQFDFPYVIIILF